MFVTDSRLGDEKTNSRSLKAPKQSHIPTRVVGSKSYRSSSLTGKKLFSPFQDLNHVLKAADEISDAAIEVLILLL